MLLTGVFCVQGNFFRPYIRITRFSYRLPKICVRSRLFDIATPAFSHDCSPGNITVAACKALVCGGTFLSGERYVGSRLKIDDSASPFKTWSPVCSPKTWCVSPGLQSNGHSASNHLADWRMFLIGCTEIYKVPYPQPRFALKTDSKNDVYGATIYGASNNYIHSSSSRFAQFGAEASGPGFKSSANMSANKNSSGI